MREILSYFYLILSATEHYNPAEETITLNTSIIALHLGLISRGIRNVEIIDVADYGNGINVCFKEADGNVWCLTDNIMPEEWCELLKRAKKISRKKTVLALM